MGEQAVIRATVRNGTIQPVDALPPDWPEGQVLLVEPLDSEAGGSWCEQVEKAMAGIPDEDHVRLMAGIDEHRREAKQRMREEMGS